MQTITALIDAALQLGDPNNTAYHGRLWQSEGGRSCPIGWEDCSQTVYVDAATGENDYGEPGGPGHADCERHCPHGRFPNQEG
ncbi:hypothetical protein D3C87_1128490 [compost metagenome]